MMLQAIRSSPGPQAVLRRAAPGRALGLAGLALAAVAVPALAQTGDAPVPSIPGLVVSMPPPGPPPSPAPAPGAQPLPGQQIPGLVVTPPAGPPPAAPPAAAQPPRPKAQPPRAEPQKAAKPKPARTANAEAGSGAAGAGTRIVALVNDEPITGFAVEQRARFMALSTNIGDRARANMQALAKNPAVNERLKAILQETINANPGKSREQIIAAFEERKKAYVLSLQKQAVDSARSSVLPGLKKQALEELIEERLKLQEAKRLQVVVADAEVDKVFADLAQRNKMTAAQFAEHIGKQGADARVMKDRFRASLAWREVVRRRYGHQISVSGRDIEKLAASAGGEEAQELKLQLLTLTTTGQLDQRAMAARLVEANALRARFKGCPSMSGLAQGQANARFEDLGFRKPSGIAEPTRSLLLAAKDGEMLPANLGASGVELYAVCGRRIQKIDEEKRQAAENQLTMKEFEKLAARYLYDLRKDALIEMR